MAISAISSSNVSYTPSGAGPAAGAQSERQAQALTAQLKTRDTEVRQHEQAHLAAAGGLALSGPSYTYERGPNGVHYAVAGEVQIDTSPAATPAETVTKARSIAAAALAPADPSGPDRAVAAQAAQLEQQARAELAVQQNGAAIKAYGDSNPAPPSVDVYA